MFTQMFDEGDYFCTFDLRNGYHHINIHPLHRTYLGFEWLFSCDRTIDEVRRTTPSWPVCAAEAAKPRGVTTLDSRDDFS